MGIQFTDCCIEDSSFIQNTTRLEGTRRRTRYHDFGKDFTCYYALFMVRLQAFAIGIKHSCCVGSPQCLVNTVLGKQAFCTLCKIQHLTFFHMTPRVSSVLPPFLLCKAKKLFPQLGSSAINLIYTWTRTTLKEFALHFALERCSRLWFIGKFGTGSLVLSVLALVNCPLRWPRATDGFSETRTSLVYVLNINWPFFPSRTLVEEILYRAFVFLLK